MLVLLYKISDEYSIVQQGFVSKNLRRSGLQKESRCADRRQQKRRTLPGPPFWSAIRRKPLYSATIAPVGQAPSQAPQSMQAPASTTATPSSTFTAPTGQAPSQAPQPMQPSVTLCAIVELSFRPVPNNLSGNHPQRFAPARPQPASLCTGAGPGARLCADCSKDKPKRQD